MKIIGLEEHFHTPEILAALRRANDETMLLFKEGPTQDRLLDLGEGRLREMDRIGLDRMVLSLTSPATQALPPAEAVPLARQANDRLAAAVRAHPDRFSGFATLPTPDPAAAVAELRRCVQELGFCGAMLHGRTGERYLDHPDFRPLLAEAAALGVPLYLHPQVPPRAVREVYYDGFGEALSNVFATGGWGWHLDAGIGALRLMVAGVFDEHPDLQIILGHWGETVAFFLERANQITPQLPAGRQSVADCFRQHFSVTGSGIYHLPYLLSAIEVMGIDRVLYSTDYPFVYHPDGLARQFLEDAPLSEADKAKIAHGNAERLLKLG